MRDIDVLLVIEHPTRELDAVLSLAKEIKRKYRLRVSIVQLQSYFHIAVLSKPAVIAFHFVNSQKLYHLKFLRQLFNFEVMSFNFEQYLSQFNMEYKKPKDNFARRKVHHLSWCPAFSRYLHSSGVEKKNIHEVGNLKQAAFFKLLSDPLYSRKIGNLKREYLSDKYKQIIFVPFNCGYKFMTANQWQFRINNGFNPKILIEFRKLNVHYFDFLADSIYQLSQKYEKYLFIIRPRPDEPAKLYVDYFENRYEVVPQNILITKKHNSNEIMIISNLVVSNWSTVVKDAIDAGVPGYFLMDEKNDARIIESTLFSTNPAVRNVEELSNKIKTSERKTFDMLNFSNRVVASNAELVQQIFLGSERDRTSKEGFRFLHCKLAIISFAKYFLNYVGISKIVRRYNNPDFIKNIHL